MEGKRPIIIAHRGFSARYPENTLIAFEKAMQAGAQGVEFDVWKCGSGEVVVTHNRELELLTGQNGDVEKFSLRDLKKMDFGGFKGSQFLGEKIPTLEEVLDLVGALPLINVEIKSHRIRSQGIERNLIQILRRRNLLQRTIISSFNPIVLFRLKHLEPEVKIGLLFHQDSQIPLRRAWVAPLLQPFSLHPAKELISAQLVGKAHQKKQKVIAWTINNNHYLDLCVDMGVDGLITDDPDWMQQSLEGLGGKGRHLCP
jgi:glycerophosphoryl diester phosphodiesterase